jgi:hypothetical protein
MVIGREGEATSEPDAFHNQSGTQYLNTDFNIEDFAGIPGIISEYLMSIVARIDSLKQARERKQESSLHRKSNRVSFQDTPDDDAPRFDDVIHSDDLRTPHNLDGPRMHDNDDTGYDTLNNVSHYSGNSLNSHASANTVTKLEQTIKNLKREYDTVTFNLKYRNYGNSSQEQLNDTLRLHILYGKPSNDWCIVH